MNNFFLLVVRAILPRLQISWIVVSRLPVEMPKEIQVSIINQEIPCFDNFMFFHIGIIIASGRGQTEVVKLLLKNGANVEDSTSFGIFEGKTALCWASSQGRYSSFSQLPFRIPYIYILIRAETVSYLIKAGANPQKPPDKGVFAGKNALMWAASQGRTEVVRLLIAAGVDVNYVSQTGNFKVLLLLSISNRTFSSDLTTLGKVSSYVGF